MGQNKTVPTAPGSSHGPEPCETPRASRHRSTSRWSWAPTSRAEHTKALAPPMDPGHLSPDGFSSWDAPVAGLSVPDPVHPGGLANEAAPHTPNQARFDSPWRGAGRSISSWESSGSWQGAAGGAGRRSLLEGQHREVTRVPSARGCPGPASLSGMQHPPCHTTGPFPWGIRLD